MKIRLCFYIVGISFLGALEAEAADRAEVLSRLSLSHMHYLKSCFAFERGDLARAKDELRLAQVLDEGPYLRSAKPCRTLSSSSSQEQLRGELSGL